MDFSFALDTEIRFGPGTRRALGEAVAARGGHPVLVTGARSLDAAGHADTILESLAEAGVSAIDRVAQRGEPDDAHVTELARRIADGGADVVVAVGGGSVLDVAKAAAVVSGGTDLHQALAGEPVRMPGIPVIAVPTTAGSGAEVSRGAIILDRAAGRKRGVRGRAVAPRAAIVDPELYASCSEQVTAEAGLDAMAHALETAVSRAASPLNVLLAGDALRRLLHAVPAVMANRNANGERASSAYAAMIMGINLATSTTCLPHRLQYPIGASTRSTHARGVAALLPAWLDRTERYGADRLAALARSAGIATTDRHSDLAAALVITVLEWIEKIGMRTSLSELGLTDADVDDLVPMVEGTLHNDPGPVDRAALAELYRRSL